MIVSASPFVCRTRTTTLLFTFPKIADDCRRCSKTSDNCRRYQKLFHESHFNNESTCTCVCLPKAYDHFAKIKIHQRVLKCRSTICEQPPMKSAKYFITEVVTGPFLSLCFFGLRCFPTLPLPHLPNLT